MFCCEELTKNASAWKLFTNWSWGGGRGLKSEAAPKALRLKDLRVGRDRVAIVSNANAHTNLLPPAWPPGRFNVPESHPVINPGARRARLLRRRRAARAVVQVEQRARARAEEPGRLPRDQARRLRALLLPLQRRAHLHPLADQGPQRRAASPAQVLRGGARHHDERCRVRDVGHDLAREGGRTLHVQDLSPWLGRGVDG
eukprot:6189805-Pleurochrysis_carterae.AAC.9